MREKKRLRECDYVFPGGVKQHKYYFEESNQSSRNIVYVKTNKNI